MKAQWNISTIKIFLENTNPDLAIELLYDMKYILRLLEDIRVDYKNMLDTFGENDNEVIKYYIAIQDIRDWIKELNN